MTTARELSNYIGWVVRVPRQPDPQAFIQITHREVVVDEFRGPWTYKDRERIAVTDKSPNPPWAGVEYSMEADDEVTPLRPFRPKAKRAAKAAS